MARPEISAAHLRFCEEYTKDRNATRAALAAGLSESYFSAADQASDLLKKPEIRIWVKHLFGVQARRLKTAVPDVVREWAILGKSDLTDYIVDQSGRVTVAPGVPRSALRAVKKVKQIRTTRLTGGGDTLSEEVRTEIELHAKDGPLKALYDHLHGPLPGEDKTSGTIELAATIAALIAARQPDAGPAGGAGETEPGSYPVVAEPGAAGAGVPELGR
jgi:phage terminase small subunit